MAEKRTLLYLVTEAKQSVLHNLSGGSKVLEWGGPTNPYFQN